MLLPMAVERHSFIPGTVPPGTRGQARPGTSSAGGGGGVQRAPGTKTRRGSTNWDSMFGKGGKTRRREVVAFSSRPDFFYMHLNDKDKGEGERIASMLSAMGFSIYVSLTQLYTTCHNKYSVHTYFISIY